MAREQLRCTARNIWEAIEESQIAQELAEGHNTYVLSPAASQHTSSLSEKVHVLSYDFEDRKVLEAALATEPRTRQVLIAPHQSQVQSAVQRHRGMSPLLVFQMTPWSHVLDLDILNMLAKLSWRAMVRCTSSTLIRLRSFTDNGRPMAVWQHRFDQSVTNNKHQLILLPAAVQGLVVATSPDAVPGSMY